MVTAGLIAVACVCFLMSGFHSSPLVEDTLSMTCEPEDKFEAEADPTDDKDINCPTCGDSEELECSECHGDGLVYSGPVDVCGHPCELCEGDGFVPCDCVDK